MTKNSISLDEYKKIIGNKGAGTTGAVRKDNTEAKVLRQTISQISSLLPNCEDHLFPGSFGIECYVFSNTNADADNIGKGIVDALQGCAFKNDKQCKDTRTRIYDS